MIELIKRWQKARNIKWIIQYHKNQCIAYSQSANNLIKRGELSAEVAIDTCAEMKVPHEQEIERLLIQLEQL